MHGTEGRPEREAKMLDAIARFPFSLSPHGTPLRGSIVLPSSVVTGDIGLRTSGRYRLSSLLRTESCYLLVLLKGYLRDIHPKYDTALQSVKKVEDHAI